MKQELGQFHALRRFVAVPAHSVPLPGGNEFLVIPASDGHPVAVSSVQMGVFAKCVGLRTIVDHAVAYHSGSLHTTDGVQRHDDSAHQQNLSGIIETLQSLVSLGLLSEPADPLPDSRAASTTADSGISSFAVVTCERPDSLDKCIKSYARNFRAYGRCPHILVSDDSRSESVRNANRRLLDAIVAEFGLNISYLGIVERRSLVCALAKTTDVPRQVIDSCLFGSSEAHLSTGANRNFLLLHTHGAQILAADDDTVCTPMRHPGTNPNQLECCQKIDQFRDEYSLDRISVSRRAVACEVDLIGLHERLLGRQLQDVIAGFGATENVAYDVEGCPGCTGRYELGDGRISLTFSGISGDSGCSSSVHLLSSRNYTRQQLVRSFREYQRRLTSRSVQRLAGSFGVTTEPWCMTTSYSFDNRSLLPPFMPSYRNQDGLFGETLKLVNPRAYFGHIPVGVVHEPPRSCSTEWPQQSTVRLCDVIKCVLTSVRSASRFGSIEGRMTRLGLHLVDVGQMSPHAFADFVYSRLVAVALQQVRQWSALLTEYSYKPSYWAQDIRQQITFVLSSVQDRRYWIPQEFSSFSETDAIMKVRAEVELFGRILLHWPTLVTAAEDLINGERVLSCAQQRQGTVAETK